METDTLAYYIGNGKTLRCKLTTANTVHVHPEQNTWDNTLICILDVELTRFFSGQRSRQVSGVIIQPCKLITGSQRSDVQMVQQLREDLIFISGYINY